jgi:predicted transcriptional regulator
MAHDEDDFRIRPGKVRDRGGRLRAARRIGGVRGRPTSFIGEVHQAIRRAGGNPNRLAGTGRGSGRFNARTRSRRVAVKARVVKLNPQRGAARGRQFVSAKAVDAHLRYLERDGIARALASLDRGKGIAHARVSEWVASWETPKERRSPRGV